jgi:hypothetical protein
MPCSPLGVNLRFGGTYRLHLQGILAELIFSTLKMEAICSSETSVDIQWTTRRYIPEDCTLHNNRCENLKSYTIIYVDSNGFWRWCITLGIIKFLDFVRRPVF